MRMTKAITITNMRKTSAIVDRVFGVYVGRGLFVALVVS